MKTCNAKKETFEEVVFLGIRGLFTKERVDPSSVPYGLYCYHLVGHDGCTPSALWETYIEVHGHIGTVILEATPSPRPGIKVYNEHLYTSYILFESEVGLEMTGKKVSLLEFVASLKRNPAAKPGHMTAHELISKALLDVKSDSLWSASKGNCLLDYVSVDDKILDVELTRCGFDTLSYVTYGGSEGIYAGIYIQGVFSESGSNERLHLCTLKALSDSKEAYLTMHQYAALICYYAGRYLEFNLSRFD